MLRIRCITSIAVSALILAGCESSVTRPTAVPPNLDESHVRFPSWGAPIDLGSPIDVVGADTRNAFESRDEQSLFFGAIRDGGFGGRDLYVSRRDGRHGGWLAPVNLGPVVNSSEINAHGDNHPNISPDGHWLFFSSVRAGGCGGKDIWMSYRSDVSNDLGWGTPHNLGCTLNSVGDDASPFSRVDRESHRLELYFVSNRGVTDLQDVYRSVQGPNGSWSTPELVSEVSSEFDENKVTLRHDGREMYLSSDRPLTAGGEEGDYSTWVSTRRSTHDHWSAPRLVVEGFGLPSLSWDGRRLYVVSISPRDATVADLFVMHRTSVGEEDLPAEGEQSVIVAEQSSIQN